MPRGPEQPGGGVPLWWVVFYNQAESRGISNPGGKIHFDIVRANTKGAAATKVGDSLGVSVTKTTGPYDARNLAEKAAANAARKSAAAAHNAENQPGGNFGWITGIGGDIASGIEGGVVAILKDLWNVIEGPLLIIVGVIVAVVVLIVFFKNDLIQAGSSLAALGAVGAV